MCQGKVSDVTLREVRPDGQIWFVYSSPTGYAKIQECLRDAATQQGKTAVAAPPPASAPAPSTPATTGASVVDSSLTEPRAPIWKIGDEWAYRYDSPSGSGTFVWSVVREESLGGTACYVLKTAARELFYRKQDFALMQETVSAVVVRRDRTTRERTDSWEVVGVEQLSVPAGTFQTIRILSSDVRTGRPAYELWYAPIVKQMVKIHEWLESGERTREMIAYKIQ